MPKISEEDQPYMTRVFWMKKENHYWENDMYSDKLKSQMRKWVAKVTSINCGTIF